MLRFCEDIGLFATDRDQSSCNRCRTDFCAKHCYNNKLYKLYPKMRDKDIANEFLWQREPKEVAEDIANQLAKARRFKKRARLCTRGEPINSSKDIQRIIAICASTPDTTWWCPTKAWRDAQLRSEIEQKLFSVKNLKILASIDPSITDELIKYLKYHGWSTMFFGDNTATAGRSFCPKTWKGKKGHCAVCEGGCFSKKQVHVHLKMH